MKGCKGKKKKEVSKEVEKPCLICSQAGGGSENRVLGKSFGKKGFRGGGMRPQ